MMKLHEKRTTDNLCNKITFSFWDWEYVITMPLSDTNQLVVRREQIKEEERVELKSTNV